MFIGHFGIALDCKLLQSRLLIGWVIGAAFLPDIVRLLLSPFGAGLTLNLLSHSLPAIAIEAMIAAALYLARYRQWGGALAIALACCTHYPLDLVTGCKATWQGGPIIGLALYQSPLLDYPIEGVLLLASWWAFRRRYPNAWPSRRRVIAGLLAAQIAVLVNIAVHTGFFYAGGIPWRWTPAESITRLRRMPPPPRACPQPELGAAGELTS